MMGAGSSGSRDAKKQNKMIETNLKKDKLNQINVIKLLLLGHIQVIVHYSLYF